MFIVTVRGFVEVTLLKKPSAPQSLASQKATQTWLAINWFQPTLTGLTSPPKIREHIYTQGVPMWPLFFAPPSPIYHIQRRPCIPEYLGILVVVVVLVVVVLIIVVVVVILGVIRKI